MKNSHASKHGLWLNFASNHRKVRELPVRHLCGQKFKSNFNLRLHEESVHENIILVINVEHNSTSKTFHNLVLFVRNVFRKMLIWNKTLNENMIKRNPFPVLVAIMDLVQKKLCVEKENKNRRLNLPYLWEICGNTLYRNIFHTHENIRPFNCENCGTISNPPVTSKNMYLRSRTTI